MRRPVSETYRSITYIVRVGEMLGLIGRRDLDHCRIRAKDSGDSVSGRESQLVLIFSDRTAIGFQ